MKFKQYIKEAIQMKSVFDSSTKVKVIYKDDPEYVKWKKRFKSYGIAVGDLDKKTITWSGEEMDKLSKDEILFVEAHEHSHFKLGKKATEEECDWAAIVNLWKMGKKKAAQIGIDEFVKRNGTRFDTSELKGYKEK